MIGFYVSRYYYPKQNRPDSPDVQEDMYFHFEHLVAVVDSVVRSGYSPLTIG